MKKHFFLSLCILLISIVLKAQIRIGSNASTVYELISTTKGFLLPRMTNQQMHAVENPARGLMIFCTNCGQGDVMFFNTRWIGLSDHTIVYAEDGKIYKELISSSGRTWLDRNLGAEQVATSHDDHKAYGSLFQWGRGADGHELIVWNGNNSYSDKSGTTSTQSSTDNPNHSDFIKNSNDWRHPINPNLWQGVNGINNPCPLGFRVPTKDEFEAETDILNDLNLTYSGYRNQPYGSLINPSSEARYWSSSIVNGKVIYLSLNSSDQNSIDEDVYRVTGFSVRCIKGQSEENTD